MENPNIASERYHIIKKSKTQ